jgi:hypothetical protein
MIKRILPYLFLMVLCGCFQVQDELTIAPDGSGRVHLEVKSEMPSGMAGQIVAGAFGGQAPLYPPLGEDEAHKFFPAKDFTVQTKLQRGATGTTMIVDATFKDINALLASPYGKAHQLTLTVANNALALKAVSGVEGLARLAESKDLGMNGTKMMAIPGLAEARKKTNEMRFEFHVTLPNSLATSNGRNENNTAAWVAERVKSKDSDDFAHQLGTVMEAACPADGVKMSPVTPPRLALGAFNDLLDQSVAAAGPALDAGKIAAAAHFVPYTLQSTRVMDLTGGSSAAGQNVARLSGAIVIPVEFTPQKWGEPELEEVTDANGNNLKIEKNPQNEFMMREGSSGQPTGDDDAPAREARHLINLIFQPPEWKVKEIARIKASVDLKYFGGSQLVKIPNAIPGKWIVEMKNGSVEDFGGGGEKTISNPKLPGLGVSLALATGMTQGGMTTLSFQLTTQKSSLLELQVFDADGRPWPTILQQEEVFAANGMCQAMVLGRPKPPLSLALLFAGGGGTDVKVPILLEHVPVRGQ